ncbi:hypothetical protein HK097_005559 [Rhizophlyctis rosea]|uniref:Peroxin-19 n=1 Tax=Rhizophlyctis rosea TaxID=64517 RepID=A0AAD5SM50_9FUNG|nr:hypothetical protein HK097_005559 [Rhizophlyctis rosea]
MEDLLRGSLDGGNSEGDNDAGPLPSQADLKATMEQLVGALKDIQVNKGVGVGTDPALQKLAAGGGTAEDTRPDPAIPGFDDETMEQMMKELEAMMSSGDFENQFGGMMDQLMSKELLHEPMKDLAAKYPEWMVANASKVPAEEMEKYRRQHDIIKEIVAIYDACPETETTAEDSQRVAELMRKMQECGNPPEEILQELAPGMAMGTDDMPQNCSVM